MMITTTIMEMKPPAERQWPAEMANYTTRGRGENHVLLLLAPLPPVVVAGNEKLNEFISTPTFFVFVCVTLISRAKKGEPSRLD